MTIPEETVLVTLDVISLYPSIPQGECLDVIHREMFEKQELILFNPNLITHLLHANINNNYFQFAGVTFLQLQGTSMGAAFSPTIANIYMSVLLRNFLTTVSEKPLVLKRYIDDIFIIWPKHQDLATFLLHINSFHPSIKYTSNQSNTHIDFLDLTIFKNANVTTTHKLSVKTYQKEHNLYQYLHFSSNHPKSTFKSIIFGEAIRYIRTNSSQNDYKEQVVKFTQRLVERQYPIGLIKRAIKKANYKDRAKYLKARDKQHHTLISPIFKCIRPPNFYQLKDLVLQNFREFNLERYSNPPLFVFTKGKSLKDIIVRSKYRPSHEDLKHITECCSNCNQERVVDLPKRRNTKRPHPCNKPRCATCQHFNPSAYFKSTVTKQVFSIHHTFTCSSTNIVYLITCSKCRKQYVGKTTKALRERIYHHRWSIRVNQSRYISKHFNMENHNITNLKIQVINTAEQPENLQQLEEYWIKKLETLQPKGLNVTTIS